MAAVSWSRDKQQYYESLVNGYIRMIEKEYSSENSINDAFDIVLSYILPLFLLGFDVFHPRKFKVSDDRLSIIGKSDDGDGTFLIYSNCCKETGYNKGIHFWSVKCIKAHHYASNVVDRRETYIGIKNERKKLWIYETWIKAHEGGIFYHLKGELARKYWKLPNNIITVKLDCHNWTITYFHGIQVIRKNYIKPMESYYFVLQLHSHTDTHFRVVPTPNSLMT